MKSLIITLVGLIATVSASLLQGQKTEFVDGYNARHARKKPVVGDSLKDVKLFDAEGKKFSTKTLKGKHTVLVFGCLT